MAIFSILQMQSWKRINELRGLIFPATRFEIPLLCSRYSVGAMIAPLSFFLIKEIVLLTSLFRLNAGCYRSKT